MREIKFRAWDEDKKCFVTDVTESARKTYLDYTNGYLVRPCMYELMQYTGLKDKNGKEIYEGDIVKAYKHGDSEKPGWIGEVTFNNGCFCFRGHNWHEFLNWFRMIEVVGNIYEQEVQNAE